MPHERTPRLQTSMHGRSHAVYTASYAAPNNPYALLSAMLPTVLYFV